MQIGEPLRRVVVEPLELPVENPTRPCKPLPCAMLQIAVRELSAWLIQYRGLWPAAGDRE